MLARNDRSIEMHSSPEPPSSTPERSVEAQFVRKYFLCKIYISQFLDKTRQKLDLMILVVVDDVSQKEKLEQYIIDLGDDVALFETPVDKLTHVVCDKIPKRQYHHLFKYVAAGLFFMLQSSLEDSKFLGSFENEAGFTWTKIYYHRQNDDLAVVKAAEYWR